MRTPKVIAFCGAHGAGKDYIAGKFSEILDAEGISWINKPFSFRIKELCSEFTGKDLELFYSGDKNQTIISENFRNVSVRELMVYVTNFGFNVFGDTFWFDLWDKEIQRISKEKDVPDIVLVTDFKYSQAIKYIRKYNGIVVHVDNPQQRGKLKYVDEFNLKSCEELADITILNCDYDFNYKVLWALFQRYRENIK